ncbi:trehalose-phosphatase [Mycolicibacterium brumae]|uniref:Trehalose 6-phosphate phosphatase n=1 Tax=Mycolicibacterium brumae TaxID=85968 RepID=A0A2G5P563_9MYCO|nr:trehalose-phosphatase [Mycolicibacterium brumae]MCV7191364.1 trehalose-phosphatase [Mycolicibacterium brumae]PIB73406.1 trehalose-phosphatase [Mycolicibacterium brumae]RWA18207.1 hypothetical protein MBRU_17870 [Mycolicibacterium brumae DSM 44177]UWW07381.1 trehalose-phosphatase [Mycolicibacterium brumae]
MSVEEPLRSALSELAGVGNLLVASDFDGTLSKIVKHPADAGPHPGALEALTALSGLPAMTVALVSGREVASLRAVSHARPPIRLIGSHGAETEDGVIGSVDTDLLNLIIDTLDEIAARSPGATVEPKPAGVALHVRNASAADATAALSRARKLSRSWDAKVTEGKAVLEFSVLHTDKGEAVSLLRGECGADAVLFLGDDVTDETVFARLCGVDVGVKVGEGDTRAGFRVLDQGDAVAVLEFLLAQRR